MEPDITLLPLTTSEINYLIDLVEYDLRDPDSPYIGIEVLGSLAEALDELQWQKEVRDAK